MTAQNHTLKSTASAVAALVVTILMSWTFVDATSLARVQRDGGVFQAAASVLVR